MSQSVVSILEATRSAPPTQPLDVMLIHCRLPQHFIAYSSPIYTPGQRKAL